MKKRSSRKSRAARDVHQIALVLAKLITGQVNDAWDPEYKQAVQIDNGRIVREPMLVTVPNDEKDVCAIVKFCAREGLRLTTKSGGHSGAGYCLNSDGIVLDLRRLNSTKLDPDSKRLTLGMGCRWREVYDFLETGESGLIPVGGGCPGVGVGGFLLGGGYSFLSRSYGLGCDSMKSIKIVDATGTVHTARKNSKDSHLQDLFWASCGGGGGNFGVAVEVELEAKRPPFETMLVGEVVFPFYRISEVLPFYNKWVETLPPSMAVYGRIANLPDPRSIGERILTLLFTTVYNGPFSEGIRILDALLKFVPPPIRVEFHNMTIHEWEDYIGSRTSIAGRSAYIRSLVMPAGSMNEKVAYMFKKHMSLCPSPETFIVWTHAGAAVSDVADTDTAFPHRDARFIPELKAIWDFNKPEETRANVEWAYTFFEELAPFATGAYLNYIDPLLSDWQQKYHGKNYDRLVKIKKHWDPKGFFKFQQGIGSKFKPDKTIPLDLSPLLTT